MRGYQSALAALELRPGANRAEIEEAYRRLIKRYHPDRDGGDGARAAEITRAYRELRQLPLDQLHSAPMAASATKSAKRPVRGGRIAILVAAAATLGLATTSSSISSMWWREAPSLPLISDYNAGTPSRLAPFADLNQAISEKVIARSVEDAIRLHETGDADAVLAFSRTCQAGFRDDPSVTWFDSCAAYDEAVVMLESRDPIGDSGPFNAAAVTAREMGQGRLLSDDAMAVDGRLHEIRSEVRMALLPRLAAAAAAPAVAQAPEAN